jgi:hypothetical protein
MEDSVTDISFAEKIVLAETEKNILSCLAYFSVFRYPLTEEEIKEYIHFNGCSSADINSAIKNLKVQGIVRFDEEYYSLSIDENHSARRKKGNMLAKLSWQNAKKYSSIISGFPFVKAVFISGSLSKNFMDENSDVDYFIVTSPGRLWLCRTLLALYKKIFLLNSRKYFCINYFVDTGHLAIPDRNLFTATELLTLVPMMNGKCYSEMLKQNAWTKHFLPGKSTFCSNADEHSKSSAIKSIVEKLFSGVPGNLLDIFCLWFTLKFWKIKFRKKGAEWFHHELRSTKYVSKHHPNSFEKKVKEKYVEKLQLLDREFELTLAEHQRFS